MTARIWSLCFTHDEDFIQAYPILRRKYNLKKVIADRNNVLSLFTIEIDSLDNLCELINDLREPEIDYPEYSMRSYNGISIRYGEDGVLIIKILDDYDD